MQHCHDPPSSPGQACLGVAHGHFGSVPDALTAIAAHELVHETPVQAVKSPSVDGDVAADGLPLQTHRSEVACCVVQTAPPLNSMGGGLEEELRSDVALLSDCREIDVGIGDVSGESKGHFRDVVPDQRILVN
ncbi:hypothetical protein Dimus_034796 [Dionaea muscipula]